MATDSTANQRTLASYERCAIDYARSTEPSPHADRRSLKAFAEALPKKGKVLEIGSGPGYDADWLESAGIEVHRTDATHAFLELQRARGCAAKLLNVIEDPLGGPYAGVLAMYVFQHVDRHLLPAVFTKIARALEKGGAILFSICEGANGCAEQRGADGGAYYVAEWSKAELAVLFGALGLSEVWSASSEDAEGRWLTILAIKGGMV